MFVCAKLFTMLGAVSARFTANSDEGNAPQTSLLQAQLKMESLDTKLTIAFIGEGLSGRHSLVQTFVKNKFPETTDKAWSTGFQYAKTVDGSPVTYDGTVYCPDNRREGLYHDDLDFRADQYGGYGGPDVVLIGFDINRRFSFNQAINTWFQEVENLQPRWVRGNRARVPVMFVGLQKDHLAGTDQTQGILDEMDEMIENDALYTDATPFLLNRREALRNVVECSAKSANNIDLVFDRAIVLATAGRAQIHQAQVQPPVQPQVQQQHEPRGNCTLF